MSADAGGDVPDEARIEALDAGWLAASAASAARRSADPPGVSWKGGETEVTSPPQTAVQTPEELLAQHGMDPADWEILDTRVNRWDSAGLVGGVWSRTDLHQIRVRARPKRAPVWLVPSSGTSGLIRPKPHVPRKGKTRLTLVTTDLQVPFHDRKLHELTLRLAELIRPDEWVDLGDVLDLPSLGRHRKKPEFHATLQESLDAGAAVFAERTQAAPQAKRRMLYGNHDTRLRNWLLDHAPELFGLRRAQIGFGDEAGSVLDLDYLLRLDELGWQKAASPWGEYPYQAIWIAPGLIGVHGEHVKKGAGNSVREELKERTHSVAQGHVNKLACYTYTRADVTGPRTVFGIEGGMMCLSAGSLGFGGQTTDWTNGCFTVTTYDDGSFNVDLAPYIGGALRWRGMRLWHDQDGGVRIEA